MLRFVRFPDFPRCYFNRGRIGSVGRALDCRAWCRGFDFRDRTSTQGLEITEKWRYFLCPANGETFACLGRPRKMAVQSPQGDVKIVSTVSPSVLNTLTQIKVHFILLWAWPCLLSKETKEKEKRKNFLADHCLPFYYETGHQYELFYKEFRSRSHVSE